MPDNWTPINDDNIRHVWTWPDGSNPTHIDPGFYAEAGTPCCGDGEFEGDDMIYQGTEILLDASTVAQLLKGAP